MKKEEIKQILNLNEKFYQYIAGDFSATRQKPWKGWDRVVKNIETHFNVRKDEEDEVGSKKKALEVLDLGCGNGRFLKFLNLKLNNIKYTGLDINNDLLNEAQNKIEINSKNVTFKEFDVLKDINKIKEKYDVIVVFGLTHHIPGGDFQEKWFFSLSKILKEGGLLVLTFWEFEEEPGDYLIGWGNRKETARYCRRYSESEIQNLIKHYNVNKLRKLDDYKSDNVNRYIIFGRI